MSEQNRGKLLDLRFLKIINKSSGSCSLEELDEVRRFLAEELDERKRDLEEVQDNRIENKMRDLAEDDAVYTEGEQQ